MEGTAVYFDITLDDMLALLTDDSVMMSELLEEYRDYRGNRDAPPSPSMSFDIKKRIV